MKSKKGFSLVELMIVVVIMAILVAVAVPIFNSVTGSSRAKTCIDNQRSIISTLNNALLSKTMASDGSNEMQFYVINVKDGYRGFSKTTGSYTALDSGKVLSEDEIKALFQTAPYCPADNSKIQVNISRSTANDGTAKVTVSCIDGAGLSKDKHILGS